jgi:hypothetical protein
MLVPNKERSETARDWWKRRDWWRRLVGLVYTWSFWKTGRLEDKHCYTRGGKMVLGLLQVGVWGFGSTLPFPHKMSTLGKEDDRDGNYYC